MKIVFIAHYICNVLSFIYVLNILKIVVIHEWSLKKNNIGTETKFSLSPRANIFKSFLKFLLQKKWVMAQCVHMYLFILLI